MNIYNNNKKKRVLFHLFPLFIGLFCCLWLCFLFFFVGIDEYEF